MIKDRRESTLDQRQKRKQSLSKTQLESIRIKDRRESTLDQRQKRKQSFFKNTTGINQVQR